jgi:hypothetical protein
MEQQTNCPLCALFEKAEQMEIERSLGGSVMEPDTRIRVNESGICLKHHGQLFLQKNRLGHALLADSHTKEVLKKLDQLSPPAFSGGLRSMFGNGSDSGIAKLAQDLEGLCKSCVICESIATHMNRYLYTFIHLWKNETKFKKMWESSKGVCLPHAAELLRHAQKHLSPGNQKDFADALLALLKSALAEDEKDLEWFTLKFDYRNQDKPWGNSKNALERTIGRLRGRFVKEEG